MPRLLLALQSQIRYKIIMPYLALTLVVMMAGAAIAVGLVATSWEERIQSQLAQIARNTTDALVRRENSHLDFLRLVTFAPANRDAALPSMTDAFASADSALVQRTMESYYRYGVGNENYDIDRLIAFDRRGITFLDWQRVSEEPDQPPYRAEGSDLSGVAVVQQILSGQLINGNDKFSNLIYFQPDPQPYFYTVAPVKRGDEIVGGVLVAVKTDRLLTLIERNSQSVITTFYDLNGAATSTTLLPRTELAALQIPQAVLRPLAEGNAQSIFTVGIRQRDYRLAYSQLAIANQQIGYFSVGLANDFQVQSLSLGRNTIVAIAMILALGSVILGYRIARNITVPLAELVGTAEAVTGGDLERRTTISSSDEFGRLAVAFNQMTEHLLRLYHTSRELNMAIEVDAALDVTRRIAKTLVNEIDVLALIETRDALRYQLHSDSPDHLQPLRHLSVWPDNPLLRELAHQHQSRTITLANEPLIEPLGLQRIAGFQIAMLTPLVAHEKLIGVLIFGHREADAFNAAILPTLTAISNMAASVLYNAVLFSQVQNESSERRAILQSIADGVIVCDQQQIIRIANDTAVTMLDLPREHLIHRHFTDLPLRHVEISQELFGNPISELEHYELNNRVVRLSRAPVITEQGATYGEVIVLHDITAEVALDHAKTDFIATISHELRSPLTVIYGNVDLLLRGYIGELSADQREILTTVRARADLMNAIVKNVILVASIEANTLETQLEPIDIGSSLEYALGPMRKQFATKDLEIHIALPETLPPVYADREQLQIILTQLLDNARRYTSTGSITITGMSHNGTVQVDIIDTGPGIAPEIFRRLFSRFQRVEGNNSTERGSGLGLVITRQLVERQGGRVWATSEVGCGSTFSFSLPITHEHANALVSGDTTTTAA